MEASEKRQADLNKVAETVQQKAEEVSANVSASTAQAMAEARRAMRENADTAKDKASDALLNAADTIRTEALKGGNDEMIRQAGQLSRGIEKAALYLDSHTLDQIGEEATEMVKQNMWQTLGLAALIGLLLGMILGGNRGDRR